MKNELTFLEKQPLSIRLQFEKWAKEHESEIAGIELETVFDLWCCYFAMPEVLNEQIECLKPQDFKSGDVVQFSKYKHEKSI